MSNDQWKEGVEICDCDDTVLVLSEKLDYVYSIANNLAMLFSVQLGNHLMI